MRLQQCVHSVLLILAAALVYVGGDPKVSRRQDSQVLTGQLSDSKPSLNGLSVPDRQDTVKDSSRGQQAQKKFDPKRSWLRFVRRSERNDDRRTRKRKIKRTLRGPPGPAGPPGHRGRPGLAAAAITIDVLMARMSDRIKEIVVRETQAILREKADAGNKSASSLGGRQSPPPAPSYNDLELLASLPRLSVAFQCRLHSEVYVGPRAKVELAPYQQAISGDTFRRGDAFHVADGRFYAPISGVYQFHATVFLNVRRKRNRKSRLDTVQVDICVDSLCSESVLTSAAFIKGHKRSKRENVVSASLSGLMQLQKGQYVSVFVDNDTKSNVYVTSHSSFSGLLVGV